MAGSSHSNSVDFYSKYYFELKEDSKKKYDDTIICKEDPFKRLESPDTFLAWRWRGMSGQI